jgi:hypothetical protein
LDFMVPGEISIGQYKFIKDFTDKYPNVKEYDTPGSPVFMDPAPVGYDKECSREAYCSHVY